MTEALLKAIGKRYPLSEQPAGEYAQMKVSGMQFTVRAYQAEDLGWVSVMTASGFLGLMKMDTLMITPTHRDMPLLSYDRVHAMGNDTLIYELYDTLMGNTDLTSVAQVQGKYRGLPDHDLGTHWYDPIKLPQSLSKKGKKLHRVGFDACTAEYLDAYLDAAAMAAPCDPSIKREKASVYVEGLLTHGGPSTDVFKKAIGQEKTEQLFRTVLFGTEV